MSQVYGRDASISNKRSSGWAKASRRQRAHAPFASRGMFSTAGFSLHHFHVSHSALHHDQAVKKSARVFLQVQLPPWAMALQPGVNADYYSPVYRLTLSSPVTPGGIFDCNIDTGRLELLQWLGQPEEQERLLQEGTEGVLGPSTGVGVGGELCPKGTQQQQQQQGRWQAQQQQQEAGHQPCIKEVAQHGQEAKHHHHHQQQQQQQQQTSEQQGMQQLARQQCIQGEQQPQRQVVQEQHNGDVCGLSSSYHCQQLWAPAPDGVQVPMTVLHKGDWSGPRPVLVLVYGAYGEVSGKEAGMSSCSSFEIFREYVLVGGSWNVRRRGPGVCVGVFVAVCGDAGVWYEMFFYRFRSRD